MVDHPKPIEWFQSARPEISRFISVELFGAVNEGKKHILVNAPVKCGKRVMVEAATLVLPEYKHYYVCSLNRKDVRNQQDELSKYGVDLYCLTVRDECARAILSIRYALSSGKRVVVHFDECDYGSGRTQKMAPLFNEFISNINVIKVYYSATPEEAIYSRLTSRDDHVLLDFVPPDSYMGADFFLENGLVHNPDEFFSKEDGHVFITDHGAQVIRDSINEERHIVVVRYVSPKISTDLFKSNKEHIERQARIITLNNKPFIVKVIDDKDPFPWEDVTHRNGFVKTTTHNYIIILKQTCTRGTDLYGWHHRIAAWHDSRSAQKTNLNTLLQAILRPNHYDVSYCEHGIREEDCPCKDTCAPMSQHIRMYVAQIAMEKAATGNIEPYLAAGGKQPTRTQKGRNTSEYICNFDEGEPEDYTFEAANRYIESNGGRRFNITQFGKVDGLYIPKHAIGIGVNKITGRAVTFEEAWSRKNLQYSRSFALIPCYRDLTNPDSLVWIANKKLTPQGRASPLTATRSSMFH